MEELAVEPFSGTDWLVAVAMGETVDLVAGKALELVAVNNNCFADRKLSTFSAEDEIGACKPAITGDKETVVGLCRDEQLTVGK